MKEYNLTTIIVDTLHGFVHFLLEVCLEKLGIVMEFYLSGKW